MRSKLKKHLGERLDEVSDYLLAIEGKGFFHIDENLKFNILDFEKTFGNKNDVHLEIGSGKGDFVCQMAINYPNINFIAVEKISNVIITACEKAKKLGLANVKFLNIGAENLKYYIAKDSISRIYLNFSCPYPKSGYYKRRLTYSRFLEEYKLMMKKGSEIHQKTDSELLFEFSIEEFSKCNFLLKNISLDLVNSDFCGNVQTEYEKKFVELGKKIFRLEAVIK